MKKLIFFALSLVFLSVGAFAQNAAPVQSVPQKRVLAIIGDAWHCAAPIYNTIVKKFEAKGFACDVVMDNKVPFDRFSDYDIIVISRYAYDNFKQFEQHSFQKAHGKELVWISPKQENDLEEYVKAGGKIFLHHDGHSYYATDGGIYHLAKATHSGHPPMIPVTMRSTGIVPELTAGVEPFVVSDEEFRMELDETKTQVFLESVSEKNGRTAQGWTHSHGKGTVVVFVPGHDRYSLENPGVDKCLANIVEYLSK